MLSYRNLMQSICFQCTILLAFAISFGRTFLPIILVVWIFAWLLEGNFRTRFVQIKQKKILIAFISYFTLTALSLLYTSNFDKGLFDIQQKLSVLCFPILFAGVSIKVRNNYKLILWAFVFGTLCASMYNLAYSFITHVSFKNGNVLLDLGGGTEDSFFNLVNRRGTYFSYIRFSRLMHPTYFSMYLSFAIGVIVFLYKHENKKKWYHRILYLILSIYLMFIIYLLQSSAGLICLGLVVILMGLYELLIRVKGKLITLIIVAVTIASFSVTIKSSYYLEKRMSDFVNVISNVDKVNINDKDIRIKLWYATIHVIKDNFVIGTSPGDFKYVLDEKCRSLGIESGLKNSHNQYLETFASLGIIGICILLFIVFYSMYYSIKNKNYLLLIFISILAFNFLFESVLNTISGVLFMMFFYSLFVFSGISELERSENI